jgi:hypothetical protein
VRNLLLAVKQSFVRRKSGEAMPPHRANARCGGLSWRDYARAKMFHKSMLMEGFRPSA